jgi:hypothetical protein
MKAKPLVIISGILFIQLLIAFYTQTYLLTDDLYRLVIGSQMSERQLDDYLDFMHEWQWLSYGFILVSLLLRVSFTWVCLKATSLITENFSTTNFWNITIEAEVVFAIGALASLLYIEFFVSIETLAKLSTNPFSLLPIFADNVPKWTNYFFNTLNLFELGYVLFLSYLLASESKKSFVPVLKFVASAYLPGLALWVLLVTYMSVVFQP